MPAPNPNSRQPLTCILKYTFTFLTCFVLPFYPPAGLINKKRILQVWETTRVQYGQMRKLMLKKVKWLVQDHGSILTEQSPEHILILTFVHNTKFMLKLLETKLEYFKIYHYSYHIHLNLEYCLLPNSYKNLLSRVKEVLPWGFSICETLSSASTSSLRSCWSKERTCV